MFGNAWLKTLSTETEEISLRDDGVLQFVAKPGSHHSEVEAEINVRATGELVQQPHPAYIDIRSALSVTRKAKAVYLGEENARYIEKAALHVDSTLSVFIGNMFISNKHFPVKLFHSKKDADDWLLTPEYGREDLLRKNRFLPVLERRLPVIVMFLGVAISLVSDEILASILLLSSFVGINLLFSFVFPKLIPRRKDKLELIRLLFCGLHIMFASYFYPQDPYWILLSPTIMRAALTQISSRRRSLIFMFFATGPSIAIGLGSSNLEKMVFPFFTLSAVVVLMGTAVELLMGALREQFEVESELEKQKEKALLSANAKSEFLANMSHEIRTPMNGILGNIELLTEEKLTNEQQQLVRSIHSSTDTMLSVINDILDFSKIESGKLSLERQPFDLIQMLQSLKNTFEYSFEKKDLNFVVIYDSVNLSWFLSDSLRIRQILANFLSNALKFTRKGKVTLEVKVNQIDDHYADVDFVVTDSGIGVSKEKMQKLFQPFTQADVSTTREFGGTGLGLSISKKLAEMLNGKIYIDESYNKGLRIGFKANFEITSKPKILTKTQEITTADFSNLRILVAEDNEINIKLIEAFLLRLNVEPTVVKDGREAVQLIEEGKVFDLIFMDCQMPIMDGYEATRKIREMGSDVNQPLIIALTASALKGEMDKCIAIGMDDFLSKPLSRQSLLQKMLEYFESSGKISA